MSRKKKKAQPVGIVDIGSNSIRLVVYDVSFKKPRILFQDKASCGLAKGMRRDRKQLNRDGMKKALQTLRRFREMLDENNVAKVMAIGTAAMRLARHGAQGRRFHAMAERALGHRIRIISGPLEAQLGAAGVMNAWPKANGICGDLGGGSLELTRVKNGKIYEAISLPLGSLTLLGEAGGDREMAAQLIRRRLQRLHWLHANKATFYTIGGSWRAVARVLDLKRKSLAPAVHGKKVAVKKAHSVLKRMAKAEPAYFKKMGKKIQRRAAVLPVAALVLNELLAVIKPKRIVFSGHGVREGLLKTKLRAKP